MTDLFAKKTAQHLRYVRPTVKPIPARKVKWEHAKTAAANLSITHGDRIYFIVSGNFIFAEFIEAIIYKHNWHIKRMIVSTLSMSYDNVFTFKNLIKGNYVEQLDVILNNAFYVHERNGIVRALVQECDIDDKFQLAIAGTHCKIIQIETMDGLKITIHGSSNLRSSGNLEQGIIETDADIYDFNEQTHDAIITKYATIDKAVRRKVLWDAITEDVKPFDTMEF